MKEQLMKCSAEILYNIFVPSAPFLDCILKGVKPIFMLQSLSPKIPIALILGISTERRS